MTRRQPDNMDFSSKLLPALVDGGFQRAGYWVWCGSVARDDDGTYHMFASMWQKRVPFAPNWLTHSRVVRAVSSRPGGPYRYVADVLPPRHPSFWDGRMTHNPTIHRSGKTWLLFYTGTTFADDLPESGAVSPALRLTARRHQRIGLAVAERLEGPWQRPDLPCLEANPGHWDALMTTNAAPCVLPDGAVLLLYKSAGDDRSPIQYGVARAASWQAPFQRIGPDRPIVFDRPGLCYEDAYVWRQHDCFWMLFNDLSGRVTGEDHAGALATSDDGINWRLAAQPKAYSRNILWDDGRRTRQGSFERPQLLIEDGLPTHLFAATSDGKTGFWNAEHTWNTAVPLLSRS